MARLPLIVLFSVLAASNAVSLDHTTASACDPKDKTTIREAKQFSQWGLGVSYAFSTLRRITEAGPVSRPGFLKVPIAIIESVCQLITVINERSILTGIDNFNKEQPQPGQSLNLSKELTIYKTCLLILTDFYTLCRDHKGTCGSAMSDEALTLMAAKKAKTEMDEAKAALLARATPAGAAAPAVPAAAPAVPVVEKTGFGASIAPLAKFIGLESKTFAKTRTPTPTCRAWYEGLRGLGFDLVEAMSSYWAVIGSIRSFRGTTVCPGYK